MAQNFAVAHEGNPRVDSLEVPGGSLQSDAIRTIKQTGPGATDGPGDIPPVPSGEPTGSSSGTDKYIFSVDDQGDITFKFANQSQTGEVGAGSVQEFSFRNGKNLSGFISINPTTSDLSSSNPFTEQNIDFFRLRQLQNIHVPDTTITINQVVTATIDAVSSSPISGLAVLVDPISTADEFYGFVAAYDWSTTTGYLMQYEGEPLTTLGRVLTSETVAVVVGDLFQANFTINPNNGSPTAEFFASFGTASSNPTTSPSVPTLVEGMGVALVDIASSASHTSVVDDTVTWELVEGRILSD